MIKIITSAFCNVTGKDPFELLSPISNCLVCNATGKVEVEQPLETCVFCGGTGKNPLSSRISCIVCGGKGNIHYKSNTICTQCKGTGRSSDCLPYIRCGGKGIN